MHEKQLWPDAGNPFSLRHCEVRFRRNQFFGWFVAFAHHVTHRCFDIRHGPLHVRVMFWCLGQSRHFPRFEIDAVCGYLYTSGFSKRAALVPMH